MSTAKLLRWLQEHRVRFGEESSTVQPRGDQEPPSFEESQKTQVWFNPADWKTQKHNPLLLSEEAKVFTLCT